MPSHYGSTSADVANRRDVGGRGRLFAVLAAGSLLAVVAMAVASGVSRGIGPIAAISLDGRIGRRWYMQHKNRNESGNYWPGIDSEDVIPDQDVERGDLEVPKWIGNGYGIYVSDGKAAIHKGFFGPCSDGDKCANMDVCIKGRCMSVIHNGTRALCERISPGNPDCELLGPSEDEGGAEAGAGAPPAAAKSRQQQLMVNMQYTHHEIGKPGGGGAVHDDGRLPPLPSSAWMTSAEHSSGGRSSTASQWQDPVSGEWDNDHARRGGRRAAGSTRKNSARAQQLAEGGTPIDFTFGIGPDGEAPIRIKGEAQSVRTGMQDPNAPDVLPYAKVEGSGTEGGMTTVGYFN